MNESFKSQTIIRPKAIFKTPIQNLKTTELEDIVFSKKYDVYTDDEIESRVILTTGLMNKLNEIENKFNIKKINVAFYKNNLYIALHSKRDMFKICSLRENIDNPKNFSKFFEEIFTIYGLIDYLKLIQ